MPQYELKLLNGRIVVWEGKDETDAIERYVDSHRDETVIAIRNYPRHGVFVGSKKIIDHKGD